MYICSVVGFWSPWFHLLQEKYQYQIHEELAKKFQTLLWNPSLPGNNKETRVTKYSSTKNLPRKHFICRKLTNHLGDSGIKKRPGINKVQGNIPEKGKWLQSVNFKRHLTFFFFHFSFLWDNQVKRMRNMIT